MVRMDADAPCLSGSDLSKHLLSFVIFSVSVDSLGRLVGRVCGPDKSKGHSALVRRVPDELRFFDSPTHDFRDISCSELLKLGGRVDVLGVVDADMDPGKLEAAAERAKDKRAW